MEDGELNDIEDKIWWWYPRQTIRRTNWLYRIRCTAPLWTHGDVYLLDLSWASSRILNSICHLGGNSTDYCIWEWYLRVYQEKDASFRRSCRENSNLCVVWRILSLSQFLGDCLLSSVKTSFTFDWVRILPTHPVFYNQSVVWRLHSLSHWIFYSQFEETIYSLASSRLHIISTTTQIYRWRMFPSLYILELVWY